ncbi:snRNA-activating protein complex subunit 4 isoform X3 [Eleginops maclovinus]|uniref:snRNA-activating protein complex subunit 4 isoform X3 n=1 Tax=Eleginops maclovinus TaxID=56733 RepID=UPI00307FE30F
MSVSLSAERDRIQRQVEELEQSLSATNAELQLLSSETDESEAEDSEEEARQSTAGLLAEREKIQKEIQNLESALGAQSPACETVSDADDGSSEETELVSQLSGPIRERPREPPASSSCQQSISMYLGRFLKPYFKDKLTGLGPPANQEARDKASRMSGCLDDKQLKIRRWESWQKTLLIHSVSRDSLRKLIQPKLSKVDYLSQKLSSAAETDRQPLREQIDSLEREIDLLRGKKEEELIGDRYDEHDWQKISNIDFEGTRDSEDIRCFWQNFLHPSVSKAPWSKDEVQQLREVSRRHEERHWESIAAELGVRRCPTCLSLPVCLSDCLYLSVFQTGRTAFLCLQTFQRFVSVSFKRGGWTPTEDAQLRELVDKMRIGNFIPYTQMSYFMEGRDPTQLNYRWNQVLDPSLKKGFWTKEEDKLLLDAVSRHGEKDWWKIRLEVPGRTDSSCRDRYHDCLKAEVKKGVFDQKEKGLLLMLVHKHGVGRWARIAAEIPQRNDAQCMREWRKLSRAAPVSLPKGGSRSRRGGALTQKEKGAPTRKRRRKRWVKVKQEEELKEESSEEEAMEVPYKDSDEEEEVVKKKQQELVLRFEEEEEEFNPPPMQEWIPVDKACASSLKFFPVDPPPPGVSPCPLFRSTLLGRGCTSSWLGPRPAERRGSSLMMVSEDQLRAQLLLQAGPPALRLSAELQAAVSPWVGHLLLPQRSCTAQSLRRCRIPSSPLFLLLLQVMSVDAAGCREVIQQRSSGVVSLASRPLSVSAMLQQLRSIKEEQQELELQQKLILQGHRPPNTQTPPWVLLTMPPRAASIRPPCSLNSPLPLFSVLPLPLNATSCPASLLGQAADSPPCPAPSPPTVGSGECVKTAGGSQKTGAQQESEDGQEAAPPPSTPTNEHSSPCPLPPTPIDHAYTSFILPPCSVKPGVTPPRGKRVRNLTQRALALQEETRAKDEARRKRSASSSPHKKRSRSSKQEVVQALPVPPLPLHLHSGQTILGLTPGGPTHPAQAAQLSATLPPGLQLIQARPPGLQLIQARPPGLRLIQARPPGLQLIQARPPGLQLIQARPPGLQLIQARPPGLQLIQAPPPGLQLAVVPRAPRPPSINSPRPLPAPPTCKPLPNHFLPYKGVAPGALQFDPSLMFLESQEEVRVWLSGRGGVAVPGGGDPALPYLPPFISSLSTLSALLRARSSLTSTSLLTRGARPESSDGEPDSAPPRSAMQDAAAPSVPPDLLQEEAELVKESGAGKESELAKDAELVAMTRQLVAEHFSGNPAYQLLKARFLSCFTVPALLASLQPIRKRTTVEEEEEEEREEEEVVKKIKARGRQRRGRRSVLLCDGPGAPANHFSGIQTGPELEDPVH